MDTPKNTPISATCAGRTFKNTCAALRSLGADPRITDPGFRLDLAKLAA